MTEKIAKPKKLTLSIAPELNRLLDIQAALDGKGSDRSSLLDGLVKAHIKRPDDLDSLMAGIQESQSAVVKASGSRSPKTTYYLSVEADTRLRFHKMTTREDLSKIVENLIRDNVTHWGAYDTAKQRVYDPSEHRLHKHSKGRQNEAFEVNSPDAEAA
jgi:hypothetical protein